MSASLSSDPTSKIGSTEPSKSSMTAAPAIRRHDCFYHSIFVFKVGETLFRVPAYGLPGTSAEFKSMFTSAGLVEGDLTSESTDENPLVVSRDVTEVEFTKLLKTVYPQDYLCGGLGADERSPSLTAIRDQWTDVLKVSKLWGIKHLQELAEDSLKKYVNSVSDVEKILFAGKYGVTRWRHEAYLKIGTRAESISRKEKEQLSIETYVGLLELREIMSKTTLRPQLTVWGAWADRDGEDSDFRTAFKDIFNEELDLTPPPGLY